MVHEPKSDRQIRGGRRGCRERQRGTIEESFLQIHLGEVNLPGKRRGAAADKRRTTVDRAIGDPCRYGRQCHPRCKVGAKTQVPAGHVQDGERRWRCGHGNAGKGDHPPPPRPWCLARLAERAGLGSVELRVQAVHATCDVSVHVDSALRGRAAPPSPPGARRRAVGVGSAHVVDADGTHGATMPTV